MALQKFSAKIAHNRSTPTRKAIVERVTQYSIVLMNNNMVEPEAQVWKSILNFINHGHMKKYFMMKKYMKNLELN